MDIGWFTGVMEAEGSITAQVYTLPSGRVRLTPFICLVNSDVGILNECHAVMRELTKNERAGPRWCEHRGTNKSCWTIRIDGPSVKPILEAMLPHMRGDKSRNAEVILEHLEGRLTSALLNDKKGRAQCAGYTREEVELISSIRTHKRGKSFEAICEAPNVI